MFFETLKIEKREAGKERVVFALKGVVDAHASEPLGQLEGSPEGSEVVLDFAGVKRINSMGLALLAQEVQKLEAKGCRIRIENPSRMAAILFKVSGFGHWIGEGTAQVAQPGVQVRSAPSRPAPRLAKRWRMVAEVPVSSQLNGWFLFNTYLQQRLNVRMGFEPLEDGELGELAFLEPCRAAAAILREGYEAIAQPAGLTEEVVIAARQGEAPLLEALSKVAVAKRQSLPYLLGRFLLDERGISSEKLTFLETRSDLKAIQLLLRGQVDALFLSKRTFSGLSSFSRRQLEVLDESDVQLAARLFCAAPQVPEEKRRQLRELLLEMAEEEKGRQLLEELEIEGWAPVAQEELQMLLSAYRRYLEE